MKFLKLNWKNVEMLCKKLAKNIKSSEYAPDVLIGISRGGLIPARLLSDYLDINQIFTIRINFYKNINRTKNFPAITQKLTINLRNKCVLIIDDVSDTGKSLIVAKNHIKKAGAKEIKIATLHYKSHSMLKPDYFIEKTDAWIVYPWEKEETKRELKNKKRA